MLSNLFSWLRSSADKYRWASCGCRNSSLLINKWLRTGSISVRLISPRLIWVSGATNFRLVHSTHQQTPPFWRIVWMPVVWRWFARMPFKLNGFTVAFGKRHLLNAIYNQTFVAVWQLRQVVCLPNEIDVCRSSSGRFRWGLLYERKQN